MGGEKDSCTAPLAGGGRKTFWRSASWSSSRSASGPDMARGDAPDKASSNGQFRPFPPPPLTPRSHNSKARSCLPPLQPLSIARRSLDEWPMASSDDVGDWVQPPTPSGKAGASRPGEGLKVDISSLRSQVMKDQIAFFDKECSKVADHIYLGGDSVARNREILRQNGITHVLNCVGFVCPEYFKSDLVYKTLWLQDNPNEDITSILYDVFDYFEDVREQGGRVLVHCCQGVSRSTSLVIAYLMWREGQSFDDAFQFVKAARGIANPNMGFACQLLQCQKRVHAIPLSPNSGLRMYRMAPHSSYDALHLVPKMLTDPSQAALDSRGAFILHSVSSIYVWNGKNCHPVMENDAKAAAFQVVRYERVPGPIVAVEEGKEPVDFWDAFSSARPSLDNAMKVEKEKENIDLGRGPGVGKRRVEAYDIEFDFFYKAITGGVVPPFPSSAPQQETHLPARESSWSALRRKYLSHTLCRVLSDSAISREVDPHVSRIQILLTESSTSPPYPSPNSLLFDSNSSSKSSTESPTSASSTSSSPLLTPSPDSPNLMETFIPPSKSLLQLSNGQGQQKTNTSSSSSPSKGFGRSIAERRGGFSPLKLPSLNKDASLASRKVTDDSSACSQDLPKILVGENYDYPAVDVDSNCKHTARVPSDMKTSDGDSVIMDLRRHVNFEKNHCVGDDQLISRSMGQAESCQESPSIKQSLVYRWPSLEKLATFSSEDLDSKAVLFFLTEIACKGGPPCRLLYLWVGSKFEHVNGQTQYRYVKDVGGVCQINWNQVGRDFLVMMGFPSDLPIKVFNEEDPDKFLELLNSAQFCIKEKCIGTLPT